MKFFKPNGRTVNKDVTKYLVKWAKKSRSKYQQGVKEFLKTYWLRHVVYEEFPVAGTRMTLDLVNLTLRVAVEVQGEQHQDYNAFFHDGQKSKFFDQVARDVEKKKWCEINNLRLVEIYPKDLPITKKFLEDNNLI